jgi:hypothetical protein
MTAWLVSEDGMRLVRVDRIEAVTLHVDNERDDPDWDKVHPAKKIARAGRARIVVSTESAEVVALTCPGRDVVHARAELVQLATAMAHKHAGDPGTVYVHAMYRSWPRRRPDRVWQVTTDIPDPDWVLR